MSRSPRHRLPVVTVGQPVPGPPQRGCGPSSSAAQHLKEEPPGPRTAGTRGSRAAPPGAQPVPREPSRSPQAPAAARSPQPGLPRTARRHTEAKLLVFAFPHPKQRCHPTNGLRTCHAHRPEPLLRQREGAAMPPCATSAESRAHPKARLRPQESLTIRVNNRWGRREETGASVLLTS